MKLRLLTLMILLPAILLSQQGRLNYANKLYNEKNYAKAVEAYKDVLERSGDSLQIANNMATSYFVMGNTQEASNWYGFLNRQGDLSEENLFRLAYLERMLGKYEASNKILDNYQEKFGQSEAIKELQLSPEDIQRLSKENKSFKIEGPFMDTEASEIGAAFFNQNKVLITSTQRDKWAVNRTYAGSGDNFYDLYQVNINADGNKIDKLKPVPGELNTKYHDGMATYDAKNNYLYFTRDNYLKGEGVGYDDNKEMLLKIYRAEVSINKKGDISVGSASSLHFNSDDYSCSHPSISRDGKRLYFASDMPGGKGGVDIYYADINDEGVVGKPVNAGDIINTPYDDQFPFYDENEGVLYFASNGHKGLGGLDIFVAYLDEELEVEKIENLGAPINSSHDDFSITLDSTGTFGYFSSSRNGDDDIFQFLRIKPNVVQGNVKDYLTKNNIKDALITLSDENGNSLGSVRTDSLGNYKMTLPNDKSTFTLTASADGYSPEEKELNIEEGKTDYTLDFELKPSKDYRLLASVEDDMSGELLDDVNVIVFNEKNDTLFVGTTNELGEFIANLPNYELGDLANLNVRLEKEGYITKTESFTHIMDENSDIEAAFKMRKIEFGITDLADVADLDPIYFDLNSSYINRPDSKSEMIKVVNILKDNPNMKIEIKGNCDQRGSYEYNVWLSDRRANRAYDYLLNNGISADRILEVKGYSYDRPKASQEEVDAAPTEEEKERLYQLNRRTEFIVVSN